MITLGKTARLLDLLLDLMGVPAGAALLWVSIGIYHDGGSVGWPLVGAAVCLGSLSVVWRRVARRIRATRPRSD
ncbi:hypothetical protein ACWD48_05250 [Streptomyces sp. NPDC002519]